MVTTDTDTKPYDMTECEEKGSVEQFVLTGRTGRRPALADILDDKYAHSGTGGLALNFDALKCSESEDNKLAEASNGPASDKQSSSSDKSKTDNSENKDSSKETPT